MTPSRPPRSPKLPFSRRLVLNQWILSLFGVKEFGELKQHLTADHLEGLDDDRVHRFHRALALHFPELPELSIAVLLEYDQNIVRHTDRINERRLTHGRDPIDWKYFQYLALLFTEIYLDRLFRDPDGLLDAVDGRIHEFNESVAPAHAVAPFARDVDAWLQLNKLAFWSATGSGKTLLMHANILQYRFYAERHDRAHELNKVILLTPNEGLSIQHLAEFEASGIAAIPFRKDGAGLFEKHAVQVIEIHKLKGEMGPTTVAVESFEGNNLVLIDEGHRGTTSGEEGAWLGFRNALCETGFSFEYSATFGQVGNAGTTIADGYARSILVDYSYKYFFGDGFGKDYRIFNLEEATSAADRELYLVACLLTFHEQLRLYLDRSNELAPFNIERPLWIFVGGKVTKELSAQESADVVEILLFLSRIVADRQGSIERIAHVLDRGLTTSKKENPFADRFRYLGELKWTAEQVFDDVLATLFNAPGGGALHVENLKSAQGEIALRVGENEPFGVINVGNDAKLVKLCAEKKLPTGELEFGESLFHAINDSASTVNMLIGSKKFTEGWSSWRVSTMGLLNVGKREGSQIIQLFGRGVRLRGYGGRLKRSGHADVPNSVPRPPHLGILETLGVFGIRAQYMAQFREFLLAEGGDETDTIDIPVIRNLDLERLAQLRLRNVRLKSVVNGVPTEDGLAFRRLAPTVTLELLATEFVGHVVVDWYPTVETLRSGGGNVYDEAERRRDKLTPEHVALLNLDRIYYEIRRFAKERGWSNLAITREAISKLLSSEDWYVLYTPADRMEFGSLSSVRIWHEMALALLKSFIRKSYETRRRAWEMAHLEFVDLAEDDPNFAGATNDPATGHYRIVFKRSDQQLAERLVDLKARIERGERLPWEFEGLTPIWFGQHAYEPLLSFRGARMEISPVPLNPGERKFVEDLSAFYASAAWICDGRELYLIRNKSRGRGVGFYDDGGFYPDFILWLIIGDHQHVIFVDPKGLQRVGPSDPKIRFFETIKEIERILGDPLVSLHSYIVSVTPYSAVKKLWTVGSERPSKAELADRHVLFQEEDRGTYIREILERDK